MSWWNVKEKIHASHRVEDGEVKNDILEDMICDIWVDAFMKSHVKNTLKSDMEESLYMRCKKFKRL